MTNITDEMKIGWNACRRQVYLLAEHEQEDGPYSDDQSEFARGYRYMAKSFAKAFNAFEADNCDFLIEAAKTYVTDESSAWDDNPDGPTAA